MQQLSLSTCRDLLKTQDGAAALASVLIFMKSWPWARWGALWLCRSSHPTSDAPGRALGPEQGSGLFLPCSKCDNRAAALRLPCAHRGCSVGSPLEAS